LLDYLDARILRFACVGVCSTVLHLSLFAAFLNAMTSQAANVLALVIATLANTTVNRRWTFSVTGTTAAARHHLQSFLVFGVTWGMSAFILWLLHTSFSHPAAWVQTGVIGASMACSTVLRFVAMRTWIFRSKV
jgi:putative flippase GtrA